MKQICPYCGKKHKIIDRGYSAVYCNKEKKYCGVSIPPAFKSGAGLTKTALRAGYGISKKGLRG